MGMPYRILLPILALVFAIAPWPARAATAEEYRAAVAELASARALLATAWTAAAGASAADRATVLDRGRRIVFATVADELIPAWYGTPWDFHGTSETPGHGHIACGYFVSTILRDAGFAVERVRMAQQPSELIILTLVGEDRVWRHRGESRATVSAAVEAHGDGLYVVGLDIHVGFLVVRDGAARFCHSSYLEPMQVVCEDPAAAPAFESGYRVVGKLLDDPMVTGWLEGRAFPTKTR